jgi:transcriptional regulator with XRE-family HTH domain
MSQQAFADSLGVSRSYLGDIEVGRCDPSFNFLQSLSDVYNVNINWILKGVGDVYNTEKLVVKGSDHKFYGIFDQLTAEQQQAVFTITQEMVKVNSMQQEMKQLSDEINVIKRTSMRKE